MASVGDSRSTGKTSKVDRKYKCNPCKESGSIKDAIMYCRNCDEFMCESCASIHKVFKLSQDHVLDLVSDMGTEGRAKVRKLSPPQCADHEGKLADLYCEKHELIFCSSCRLTKHRQCTVVSLRDIAKAPTCGQQLSAALESMSAMKGRIETLKSDWEKDIEALTNMEKSCIADIQTFKTNLIERIERLEGEMLDSMKKIVETKIAVLREHVNTCDVLLPHVSADMKDANDATSVDDHMTSVLVSHRLRKTRSTAETALAKIKPKVDIVNLTFVPAPTLSDCLTNVDLFGTLQVTPGLATSLSVSSDSLHVSKHLTDMQVETSTQIDTESNSITGSAILADGQVVLVDKSNKQVILLDKMLSIKSKLKLADQPWDVAANVSDDVIVSLPKVQTLQWIDVGSGLRAGRTVTTDLECLGVAVHAGEVYTSVVDWCGGGHVLVLDGRGAVTRRIGLAASGNGMFVGPHYVTVSPQGLIFISDWNQDRVTCCSPAGDVVYATKPGEIRDTHGMLADDGGKLLVCCQDFSAIVVLGKDGRRSKTFLSSADGVTSPTSISYRQSDNTLIVTMNNTPSCIAYKLK